jgi:hypothetical protein
VGPHGDAVGKGQATGGDDREVLDPPRAGAVGGAVGRHRADRPEEPRLGGELGQLRQPAGDHLHVAAGAVGERGLARTAVPVGRAVLRHGPLLVAVHQPAVRGVVAPVGDRRAGIERRRAGGGQRVAGGEQGGDALAQVAHE